MPSPSNLCISAIALLPACDFVAEETLSALIF